MSKSYDSIDQQQIEQFILFCQDYCNLIESAEYDFENIVNFYSSFTNAIFLWYNY